jgi:hypothetical protein
MASVTHAAPPLRPALNRRPLARRRSTHLRRPSSIAATTRALPSGDFGPVEAPPCTRQRPFAIAQARQRGPRIVATPFLRLIGFLTRASQRLCGRDRFRLEPGDIATSIQVRPSMPRWSSGAALAGHPCGRPHKCRPNASEQFLGEKRFVAADAADKVAGRANPRFARSSGTCWWVRRIRSSEPERASVKIWFRQCAQNRNVGPSRSHQVSPESAFNIGRRRKQAPAF